MSVPKNLLTAALNWFSLTVELLVGPGVVHFYVQLTSLDLIDFKVAYLHFNVDITEIIGHDPRLDR